MEIDLGRPTLVNHAIVMEDYWFGERIRAYVIEGFSAGQWVKLVEGVSVGRKRIDSFPEATVTKVRLRVTKAAENPLIRRFAVFHVTNFRPPGQPPQSPWAQCGSWSQSNFRGGKASLEINLTPLVPVAGQYEVKFQKTAGQAEIKLSGEVLLQSGQASAPGMLTRLEGPLGFLVTRTAVITPDADIRLKVSLEGPDTQGVVLIRPRQR